MSAVLDPAVTPFCAAFRVNKISWRKEESGRTHDLLGGRSPKNGDVGTGIINGATVSLRAVTRDVTEFTATDALGVAGRNGWSVRHLRVGTRFVSGGDVGRANALGTSALGRLGVELEEQNGKV